MKKKRQAEILSIIKERTVENQEMLIKALAKRGYNVTQDKGNTDNKNKCLQGQMLVLAPSEGHRLVVKGLLFGLNDPVLLRLDVRHSYHLLKSPEQCTL